MKIFFLLFYNVIILFAIIGFGNLSSKFSNKNFSLSEAGFRGLLILILISYFTNFLFAHTYFHNLILIIIGICSFSFFICKKKIDIKFNSILLCTFLILFIGLLMYKNHDDFFYYHFPYTVSLILEKKIIGIGLLEHGFRTPSSIFYLNSLFYLPYIDFYLLNLGVIFYMGFSNIFFLEKIFNQIKKKKTNIILFLSILSLIFVNTAFYRLAEHGTDRSALILVLVIAIVYLESLEYRRKLDTSQIGKYYEQIIILLLLIISLKSFYIIYVPLLFLWLFQFKLLTFDKKNLELLILNSHTYLLIVGVFVFLLTVFLNTGCVVYPASFTCFPYLEWAIPLDQVDQMKNWYSLWSKAGATPSMRVDDPELYLSNFNWISNWFNTYFFTKVSDFLLILFLISVITFFSFKNLKKKKQTVYNFKYLYIFILFLFAEWFINHPALRYGGYTLIVLIFFIPLSQIINSYTKFTRKLEKTILILIFISFGIFISKNLIRISDEMEKYNYDPLKNPYFNITENAFYFNKLISNIDNKRNLEDKKYYLILTQDLINSSN